MPTDRTTARGPHRTRNRELPGAQCAVEVQEALGKENADRWNVAYIQKTTLPYEDNYLDLDPTVKDALGQPVCRITADFRENEKKVGFFMQDKMEQWFMEAGAVAVAKGPPGTMGPSTHAYGGTRMGDNRETNVVDRWGESIGTLGHAQRGAIGVLAVGGGAAVGAGVGRVAAGVAVGLVPSALVWQHSSTS